MSQQQRIKGKEAALAVIIAGIGIGIAIFADNIISERAYIKAQKEKEKAITTTLPPIIEENEEENHPEDDDNDDDKLKIIEDKKEKEEGEEKQEKKTIESPPPETFSDEEEEEEEIEDEIEQQHIKEKPDDKKEDEEDSCHEIIRQSPVSHAQNGQIYQEYLKDWFKKQKKEIEKSHHANTRKMIQLEIAQKYRPEPSSNPTDLLPGETYAQYFVRQQKLQEETKLQKEGYDDSYAGDFNEASKNLYLIKRAYTDARRTSGKPKEFNMKDPFGLKRFLHIDD